MRSVTEFVSDLTSPPDTVDEVHSLLECMWEAEPLVSAGVRMRFETALIELATNVVQHADRGNGVAWTVRIASSETSLTAEIVDSNPSEGFTPSVRRSMPPDLAEEGRGLALVHLLVDSATFDATEHGGVWRIRLSRAMSAEG
ncbi:serine/threonine-protein kinase RsbW [Labedella gwakjiensis]|uniref:ATP-binding protein n=1 Tax=Labedella gwakjiensis TaxID=390269 RepID=A0A2P8GTW2_9MICO|nr:serine/threonine-protein kinase RsbW [Labedella gwakjiensis]RUQ84719.1 ATP-binding protein [Labedella gwakjiensis]